MPSQGNPGLSCAFLIIPLAKNLHQTWELKGQRNSLLGLRKNSCNRLIDAWFLQEETVRKEEKFESLYVGDCVGSEYVGIFQSGGFMMFEINLFGLFVENFCKNNFFWKFKGQITDHFLQANKNTCNIEI